jgi:hemerythrin-like metal-binding protein
MLGAHAKVERVKLRNGLGWMGEMGSYVSGLVQRIEAEAAIPCLEWSDKLSVGDAVMDGEHRELVRLLNNLCSAVKAKRGPEAVGKALDDLIGHTAAHFKHEEALFAQTGYPEAEEHTRAHEILTIQALQVREKYQGGVTAYLSQDVLRFLRTWLVTHILIDDRKFGNYVSESLPEVVPN